MILHLDADAFFASVIQATNPRLKGKPVVSGAERGIATSISYEAKKFGVKRGMRLFEIKKVCPQCIVTSSDYELYSLFSKKMFEILRSFTFQAEEYSIDEAFADLTGLRNLLKNKIYRAKYMNFYSPTGVEDYVQEKEFFALGGNKNSYTSDNKFYKSDGYKTIGQVIKDKIESSLGITVSIGISTTKSLAKLASGFKKPSGLTLVDSLSIEKFLEKIPVADIWGIGHQTSALLNKLSVYTALQFIKKPEKFITRYLTKPYLEIWQELQGKKVYELNFSPKNTYNSITRSQTFHPPTADKNLLYSRLTGHIENAFTKARSLKYQVGKLIIYLKTQEFIYHAKEIKLLNPVSYPFLIRDEIKKQFEAIFKASALYRTTGCTITNFINNNSQQITLFDDNKLEEKVKKIYPLFEKKKVDFGTSLFEKKEVGKNKKQAKLKIPLLSLDKPLSDSEILNPKFEVPNKY